MYAMLLRLYNVSMEETNIWYVHVLYFQRTAKTSKILLTHKIMQPYVCNVMNTALIIRIPTNRTFVTIPTICTIFNGTNCA